MKNWVKPQIEELSIKSTEHRNHHNDPKPTRPQPTRPCPNETTTANDGGDSVG